MDNLFAVLKEGITPYHCVAFGQQELEKAGFETLDYGSTWDLQPGGKYVINHHGSTLFAFTVGENFKSGDMVRLGIAHTDYPTLRVKYHPDFQTHGYAQVNVEVYGGPILSTWMDRPLGIAGRVILRSDNPFEPKEVLYRSEGPVMIVPNLAIHMNREVNDATSFNPQVDMMPIMESLPKDIKAGDYFVNFIASELGVSSEDVLDFELFTFIFDEPCYVGPKKSMICSPRIDNQTSCAALEAAIVEGTRKSGINMIALYDNEEIGSRGKQGGGSMLLPEMLNRILSDLGLNKDEVQANMYNSMILSCDVAHALHPNKPGKMDITNHPVMGQGFCFKAACRQSYATDARAIGILMQICDQEGIPYQRFMNRSDVKGGSTIGSIASTVLPVPTVDIGIPQLAMHSACELMGTGDQEALTNACTAFFRL